MQPNYRFTLRKGNTTSQRRVYPLFNDDVTLKWEHDNGEYYFRKKLSGTFTFVNDDFDFVYNSLKRSSYYWFTRMLNFYGRATSTRRIAYST